MPWMGPRFGRAPRNSAYAEKRRERRANEARLATVRETALIEEKKKRGYVPVNRKVAGYLRSFGVHVEDRPRTDRRGTRSELHFAPEVCFNLVKQWEEAQVFAGPGGKVKEFRSLSLERVCWLASEEWKAQKP